MGGVGVGHGPDRLGIATGFTQGRVSQIVHHLYFPKPVSVVSRIADGLNMPGPARPALGLTAPSRTATGSPELAAPGTPRPPAWNAQYPATAEQAVTAVTALWRADDARAPEVLSAPLDPSMWNASALAWLVGQPDTTLPASSQGRAVGRADIARVRASSALFAELDNRFGGAHARRSLIHFLDCDAAGLLTGCYTDDVGRELFSAVAEASLLAAWTSYDCGLHSLAQRYFVHSLRLAQSGAGRRLACSILSAMSHQATFLGYTAEAANLARAACNGLQGAAMPVLTAQFLAMEARALARAGDAHGCHAALAAAERAFQPPEAGRDPEFISYFTQAELAAEMAHCFRDLGDGRQAVHYAAQAAPSDGQFARSDFFAGIVLTDALADQDDPEQACQIALSALHTGQSLTSARCVIYVREFRHRLARFSGNTAIRDFTEQAAQHPLWIKAA